MNLRASRLAPLLFVGLLPLAAGCDLFGSKSDPTTEEILDEGQIDPTIPDQVGYVPLNPFFTEGSTGPLAAPTDVYVGFDRLIYVGDRNGLQILDLAGRPQVAVTEVAWPGRPETTQPLRDITAIVQDRRLDVYVAARRDTTIDDRTWDLPVVYHLRGTTTNQTALVDIIWHPFDDNTRRQNQYRNPRVFGASGFSDEDASFTGVAVLHDNRVYVTRSGPVNTAANQLPSIVAPFNALLLFTAQGLNSTIIRALSPTTPSLLSAVWPSDIATGVGPPQRAAFPTNDDFFIAQAPPTGAGLRYGVLSVRVVESAAGTEYTVDTARLNASTDPSAGDGFLYGSFRFDRPSGIAFAADATGYLFVVDSGKDSLFVFNRTGIEGVTPSAGSGGTRPVRVSFGGAGAGARQFLDPEGVAYFDRTVYVADTGNNRIARFRLNTDFE